MRSMMANELSLAAAFHARRDSVGVQLIRTRRHEPAGGARLRRQVVARVVAAVARDLLLRLLVDEHLLDRSELGRAATAPEPFGEATQLAAAALLLVGRDRIAERVRRGTGARGEAERVDLRDACLAHEVERALEGGLVFGRIADNH